MAHIGEIAKKEPKTALEGRKEEGSLIECVLELVSQLR